MVQNEFSNYEFYDNMIRYNILKPRKPLIDSLVFVRAVISTNAVRVFVRAVRPRQKIGHGEGKKRHNSLIQINLTRRMPLNRKNCTPWRGK